MSQISCEHAGILRRINAGADYCLTNAIGNYRLKCLDTSLVFLITHNVVPLFILYHFRTIFLKLFSVNDS